VNGNRTGASNSVRSAINNEASCNYKAHASHWCHFDSVTPSRTRLKYKSYGHV